MHPAGRIQASRGKSAKGIKVVAVGKQVKISGIDLSKIDCKLLFASSPFRQLTDQLSRVDGELLNTHRLLTESQHRSNDLSSKMKDYLLEVERVKKLLDEKETERDEMLDNMKKLSENTCRLRGNNISLGSELCQHK